MGRARCASRRARVLLACVATLLLAPASAHGYPNPASLDGDVVPAADPSLLIKSNGAGVPEWYLYSTGNQARVSANRRDFRRLAGAVLPKPLWWQNFNQFGDFWAPDAVFLDGKYWLYYAVSNPGAHDSAIGLATSATGMPGTWQDTGGPILQSNGGTPYNALDPSVLVDYSGGRWLVFGSYFGGIYITRLDPTTGRPTGAATNLATNPAANAVEGANMVKHGGAYYLFASYGDCCSGHNSTYNVRVGRSSSPTGPFVDQGGAQMIGGGGTMVLDSHDWVKGPGGQTVVYDPSDQREKLVYHYWDLRVPVTAQDGRRLGINNIEWDASGWPYVTETAHTADVEVAEMESGSEPGPGSGSLIDGWHIFAPGYVDRPITVSDDAPYVLGVSARGRMGGGAWPILRVYVDGQFLEERTIDSIQYQLYHFTTPRLAPGQHRIRFEFLNDYYAGNLDDDRNVYLDKVTASSLVDAEAMDVRTGRGEVSDGGWVMRENGRVESSFDFSTAARYVVRIRAKGATADGVWPEMHVLVDGADVAKATVSSASWNTYELEVPAPPLEHRVAVEFANDSGARDLWVDTISVAADPVPCVFTGPTRPAGPNQDRC
jgi:arabinan endo-1,5-alpha-L-arabinosidase